MSSINKVMLIGHLGADPEVRQTEGGKSRCQFSLATNHVYRDRNDQRQEQVSWHRVVCWGKLAELCGNYLRKGRQVFVEGRLDTYSFNDKEGNKRYITEVRGEQVVFLGSARGDGASKGMPAPGPGAAPDGSLDAIPF